MQIAMRPFVISVFLCFCFLASPAVLKAQSTDGTIAGTVKDSSGAAIVDAQVTVTNADTNIAKTEVTDKFGDYEAPGLLPGKYGTYASRLRDLEFQFSADLYSIAELTIRVDVTLVVGTVQTTGRSGLVATPAITTESGNHSRRAIESGR